MDVSLDNTEHRNLLKDFTNAKLRLPDIRAIQIGHVSNSDTDLQSFLRDWTPSQLEIFRFNLNSYSQTSTNSKFYMSSLPKIVSTTTKEVFLNRLEFSEAELELIVKASRNTKSLIFDQCKIHCSTSLDFGNDLKYITKTLSFQFWGNTEDADWMADWKSNPTYFNNIIDAIAKSDLKNSLQKISICKNQTLWMESIQKILNKNGGSRIAITNEYC